MKVSAKISYLGTVIDLAVGCSIAKGYCAALPLMLSTSVVATAVCYRIFTFQHSFLCSVFQRESGQ